MARLTLARKIAAITLIVWKKEVGFDAKHLKQQAAFICRQQICAVKYPNLQIVRTFALVD
jgi:hypothetical protein